MSSCQDSMDTEDSIPRPEYEDLVPDETTTEDEFWGERTKLKMLALQNGSHREAPTNSQPTASGRSSSVSVATNSTDQKQTDADEELDETLEENVDGEISYLQADEILDDAVDQDTENTKNKILDHKTTPSAAQFDDDSPKILDKLKIVVAADSTSETNSNKNKLALGPLTTKKRKKISQEVTSKVELMPTEGKPFTTCLDEMKTGDISTAKDHQPLRSNTPLHGRGNREFQALQKSFNESKVLSEFVSEKERSRKSRKVPLKSEDSVIGDDADSERFRLGRARSKSCTRTAARTAYLLNNSAPQKWPSDEKLNAKRENMRSQNTDFVQKQMKFLNRVNHNQTCYDPGTDISDGEHSSFNESNKIVDPVDNKDEWQPPPKGGSDSFCWKCRKCADLTPCSRCPRSYHAKCIKVNTSTRLDSTWICPECVNLDHFINGCKKSKKEPLSIDMLNQLLLFALKRMKQVKGHEKFLDAPDQSECPCYAQYVVNPVTLNTIQEKIEKKAFKCTEEFVLETKWIQHNVSIAYAAYTNKDAVVAKTLLKVCRQESAEIETCSECYLNANTRKDWFIDVCLKPHILLWAKLKGFPYWPAKGMGLGPNSLVNVRFFGDHDRAFVPLKDCFLYSEVDPNPNSGKRVFRPGIADCIKEVDLHIQKIKRKVGAFNFAPPRTQYDPAHEMTQLEEMMPGVTEYIKRQMTLQKPPLTYKIVKTADNNLSIIKKPDSGTDSDHSSLGGENRQKIIIKTATELEKLSPLREAKKSKESQIVQDNDSPSSKYVTISKSTANKSMSSNYEVVAKPVSKDDNSSKINSVILKRKSDVALILPNSKKPKLLEEIPAKPVTQIEEPKDPKDVSPAKKTRSSRSGDQLSTSHATLSPPAVMPRSEPVETQDNQTQPSQDLQLQETQPQPQKPQSQQQQQKISPQAKPLQLQKAGLKVTTSLVGVKPSDTSSTMAKLVQNYQGVTIKKIFKNKSGLMKLFGSDTKDNHQSNSNNRKSSDQPICFNSNLKAIPLPAATTKPISIPPQPVEIAPKPIATTTGVSLVKPLQCSSRRASPPKPMPSPPKSISFSSSPKPVASKSKSSPPSIVEKPKVSKGLIPFDDIKLEKPDDEELISTKSFPSTSKEVDPLGSTNEKITLPQNSSSNRKSNSANSSVDPPSLSVNMDFVKKETISDDDSSSNSAPLQEKSSLTVNPSNDKQTEPPQVADESMVQRIAVRSLESLTMNPLPQKNDPPYSITSQSSSVEQTAPNPLTTNAQPKKPNPRARKSFPNKGPNSSTAMLPPEVKRSLTKNSMVYIPSDSQNNSVPIQPLTAVSKPTNQSQASSKSTSTTPTIPVSSPAQKSLPSVTKPTATLSPSTATPSPSPPASIESVTMSTSATESTNAVSAMTTAVTSSVICRTDIASLKTMSPLQLSVPSVRPTEQINESMPEIDGHILSGIVTPSLAAAITDTIVRGPPRLAPKPNGALRSDGNFGFNSGAGPVYRTLVEGAHKITDFFISVMQDTVNDMANAEVLPAKIAELQMELETKVDAYEKRLYELKQNTDTMLCEMKKSMETERIRIIAETRKQCEIERIHAVEQTKKKQWCTNCGREANCYCCWNTAYCDNTCQGMDWPRHKPNCCQVNPHLNPEIQGPGVLFSAPTRISVCSTSSTATIHTMSSTTPGFSPILRYQSCQPTPTTHIVTSPSTALPTLSQASTAAAAQKQFATTSNANVVGASGTGSSPTSDLAYKGKEILKLPPSTYLRALPSVRLPTSAVQRFNIPLPLSTTSNTGGPPYALVQREGNWEIMGTTTTVVASSASFQQPTQRLVTGVTANLPPDSRAHGQVIVRPNQM